MTAELKTGQHAPLEFENPELTLATELRARITEVDDEGRIIGGIIHTTETDPSTGESQDYIYLGNPFEESPDVIKIPTSANAEQVEEVKSEILPFPESYELLGLIAHAYKTRQPLIVEGPTSIGKTFLVNRFTELVHGRGAKPYDLYCTAQTDVSELTVKHVPNKRKTSEADPTFVLQYGALPKAMGTIEDTDGSTDNPGERQDGNILHVQEVGIAEPSIINVLLQLRGDEGQIADSIRLWDDGGAVVKPGPDFWLVMTTNPPEGYVDRNEIDPALARGAVYIRLDELSTESLQMAAHEYLARPRDTETHFNVASNPDAAALIGNVLGTFHETYRDLLKGGEKGRRQRIPATLADIARVAEYVHSSQTVNVETGDVDLTETIRRGVSIYYLRRLADTELAGQLRDGLEELLTGDLGKVKLGNQELTFSDALSRLVQNSSLTVEDRAERVGQIFGQSEAIINGALEDEFGSLELAQNTRAAQQIGALAAEFAGLSVDTDLERMEEIAATAMNLSKELSVGFNPEQLKRTSVHSLGSETRLPMSVDGIVLGVDGSSIQTPGERKGAALSTTISDQDIRTARAGRNAVWMVSNDQSVYTYKPGFEGETGVVRFDFCREGSDFEGVGILPQDQGDLVVGTKEGTIFVQNADTRRFISFEAPNPQMEVDLLEPGVTDDTFLAGDKYRKDRGFGVALMSTSGEIIWNTDIRSYTSAVALKKSGKVLVGQFVAEGTISVYDTHGGEISDGVLERAQSIETRDIIGHEKGVSYLAADNKERYAAFASQNNNVVGFLDLNTFEVMDRKLDVPKNVTGLQITPEGTLLVSAGGKVYVYESMA